MDHDAPAPTVIDPALFTFIVQFRVDADRGEAFVRDLTAAVERTVVPRAGFRSSVFHLSADRTRVVNHAQWDSAEAYHASMSGDSTDDHDPVGTAVARHGARLASASPYEVVAAFTPQG